jgi:hypothetical protein
VLDLPPVELAPPVLDLPPIELAPPVLDLPPVALEFIEDAPPLVEVTPPVVDDSVFPANPPDPFEAPPAVAMLPADEILELPPVVVFVEGLPPVNVVAPPTPDDEDSLEPLHPRDSREPIAKSTTPVNSRFMRW